MEHEQALMYRGQGVDCPLNTPPLWIRMLKNELTFLRVGSPTLGMRIMSKDHIRGMCGACTV